MIAMSLAAATAALIIVGGEASQAQEPPPRVSWLNPPDASEYDYPVIAKHLLIRASAAVICIADAVGYARECVAVAHPAGFGFEEAAIEIAKRGQIKANREGDTTENLSFGFQVPFGENLPDIPAPAGAWDGPDPTADQLTIAKNIVASNITYNGEIPFDGKVPVTIKEALATELAPENGAFLLEAYNTYGLTPDEANALAIRMYARLFTIPEVENRLDRMTDFSDPVVRSRMVRAEAGEGFIASMWRIRNAYCSRYDCTSKRAEEPAEPSHWKSRDDEPYTSYLPIN